MRFEAMQCRWAAAAPARRVAVVNLNFKKFLKVKAPSRRVGQSYHESRSLSTWKRRLSHKQLKVESVEAQHVAKI